MDGKHKHRDYNLKKRETAAMNYRKVLADIIDDGGYCPDQLENRKPRNVEKARICPFDELNFKKRFRLDKASVRTLVSIVDKDLHHSSTLNNALSPLEQVIIALRYYATGTFQLLLGDCFQVSHSTVCRVIASLCKEFISLPKTREKCEEASQNFFDVAGFPGVLGAIDCSHVKILSPGGEDAERFWCRKDFFSLNVQTISDADLLIRNVVARCPAAVHNFQQ
ncbi:putative nuclease HARBI1 [Parasteatoda tepidariorum]|uniref:putative nuclease HARBI1 n=1 Tax=Parasteatoda tepidariorum TaxID=114398 RepID=UPI0039BC9A4A